MAQNILTVDSTSGVIVSTPDGSVASVGATAPVVSSGGVNPVISMAAATDAVPGYLTSADHATFTAKVSFPGFSSTATDIKINGTQSAGALTVGAKADHTHPTDTTRATDTAVVHNTGNENIAGIKTHTDTTDSTSLSTGSTIFNGGILVKKTMTTPKVFGGQSLISINSSTPTNIALGIGFIVVIRDNGNGGAAVVLYENAQVPVIISQIGGGGTVFTTSAPTATQVQLASIGGGGGITALGGSSRNPASMNCLVLSAQ